MRLSLLGAPLAAAALMAGCAGGGSAPTLASDPVHPGATSNIALGTAIVNGDLTQAASAVYTLTVDPTTLAATLALKENRAAQKNDDLYDLSVDAFFGPGTITIAGINSDGTTVDVDIRVQHPFAAPTNLDGPATAANRADLGVATRLLFIAEAPGGSPTYFAGDGDVVANTTLLPSADGLMNPGGMITATGLTANTYPFMNVVDELLDNREGISNLASVTGNFDPTNGWTRSTMGTGNNGWTGYGVLHQGQAAIVSAQLSVSALQALGGFALDLVPVVKYNDPRQGANSTTKRANRLPPAAPDATKFGYRMPHGAQDVDSISFVGESGGLVANSLTATTLDIRVVDWDARATESAETDLSLDPNMSNVAQGESGAPTVDIDIPGVTSSVVTLDLEDDDSGIGGDAGVDAGLPGDALYYTGSVTNTGTGQSGGNVIALIRASDIEANATFNDTWRFALDPSLGLLTTNVPQPIVYQAASLSMTPPNTAPSATSITVGAIVGTGGNAVITVTGLADAESDAITFEVDWDDNGTYTPAGTFNSPYGSPLDITSPITYTYTGPGIDTRMLPARYSDGTATVNITPTLTFDVDACAADPLVSSTLGTASPFFFMGQWGTSFAPTENTTFNRHPGDWATMRASTTNALRGVIHQRLHVPGAVMEYAEIHKCYAGNLNGTNQSTAQQIMTNFGTNMFGQHIHQLEVDSTNRVLFANKLSDTTPGAPTSTIYPAGTGASANIRYFDYSGAVVDWTSVQTFSTGGSRVVAMALDQSDDVWMIDTDNVLHKYVKASAYAEQTSGGLPLDLKAAPYGLTLSGTGATDCRVHDFVIDWRTTAILILYQTREAAASPGNGYVMRLNCDLSKPTTVAGNNNPLRFVLSDSTTQGHLVDIAIDQINAAGAANPTVQASQQIAISGCTASAASPDWTFIDTNLFIRGQWDASQYQSTSTFGGKITFNVYNNLQQSWISSSGTPAVAWAYYFKYGGPASAPGWE